MWITADQVERKHRELFDESRLTRLNIEHAMKQLFGHGIICRLFVSEGATIVIPSTATTKS